MSNEIDYKKCLALLIECQEKQDPAIPHEWTLNTRAEAVRLANFLRGHNYEVENKVYPQLGLVNVYYVGVPFSSLKTNSTP